MGTKLKPQEMPISKPKNRLTTRVDVYYESSGEPPYHVSVSGSKSFDGIDEQPFNRRIKVGEEQIALELGWFSDNPKDVGVVVIENSEGKNLRAYPSEEEKMDIGSKILEVRTSEDSPPLLVYPKWPLVVCPSDVTKITLRSRSGVIKAKINLLPFNQ